MALHFEPECFNNRNPEHTGWHYPGLLHASNTIHVHAAAADRSNPRRVFYRLLRIRRFPFTYLKYIRPRNGSQYPHTIIPAQLHAKEGKEATLLRFRSWLFHVTHYEDIPSMENLHIYTADCYEELSSDVSLDEILSGKCGRMDERHPLRVVYIPGNSKPRAFPWDAFIPRGLRELLKCDEVHLEEEYRGTVSTQKREAS
jgi:hypothetical protein